MRALARPVVAVTVVAASLACLSGGAVGATSSTVVSLTVPSATYLSIDPTDTPVGGNCRANVAGVTNFGVVTPGSPAVTSSDCVVRFGSSNDTSSLRMYQSDSTGTAMRRSELGTDGELDHSLGVAGVAFGALRQPDGKLVLVGRQGFAVVATRFLSNGTPDPGFGTGGSSVVEIDTGNDVAYGVARQSDGKLVLVGSSVDPVNADQEIFVLRLLTDGTPDPGFGAGGIAMFRQTTFNDIAQDVEVQGDGRILVGGYTSPGGVLRNTVLRLLTNGGPDPSWGAGGESIIGTETGSAIGMAIQADGKVVTVGRMWTGTTWDSIIARVSSTGIIDGGFGSGGTAIVPVSANEDYLDDVVIQPDGKIVATGVNTEASPDRDLVAMRFSTGGVLDPGFGAAGIALIDTDGRHSFVGEGGVALYPDGRILVGGASVTPAGQALTTARLLANGTPDATFGVSGLVTTQVGGVNNRMGALMLHADGMITMAGSAGTTRFAVSQLHPDIDPGDFLSGTRDWSPGASMFGACLRRATNGAATNGSTWSADTTDFDCADGNADPWRPVARLSGDAGALVAVAPSGDADAEVDLRFGFRPSATQVPGGYYAQVGFEVLAPG